MASTIGSKKTITVTVTMAWLLYDIMNETFLRGRTIQNADNHKAVASMFASEDEENREKILRSIKKGFAEVKAAIAEYLDESTTTVDTKPISGNEDLQLILKMPSNFNESATAGIGEAVHDYLKNKTISEWYLVTNSTDAEAYAGLAAASMQNVLQSVSKRARPTKPTDSTSADELKSGMQ